MAKNNEFEIRLNLLIKSAQLTKESSEYLILADTEKFKGALDKAIIHYEKTVNLLLEALDITEKLNQLNNTPADIKPIVNTLINTLFIYGDVLESNKQYKVAKEKRKKAIKLSENYLGAAGQAEAERSRAAYLTSQGRFNEALISLYTARNYYSLEKNVLKSARTSLDTADLLQWLGDYKRAAEEIDYAEEVYSNAELRGGLDGIVDFVEKERITIELKYYRGLIAKFLADYNKAKHLMLEVLPKYQSMGVGPAIEYQIALIMIRSGKVKEGLDIAIKLEPIMKQSGLLRPKLAGLLNIQGEALIKLGYPEKAVSKFEEGINDLSEYYDPDLLWRLEWQYAKALNQINKKEHANDAYGKAIEVVAELRKAPLGYRLDSTYLTDKMELFQEAIAFTAKSGLAKTCAEYIDTIKSRTLSVTFSIPVKKKTKDVIPTKDKFEKITQDLDNIEYKGFLEGWTRELREERARLLSERKNLLEEIRISDSRWRSITEPVTLDMNKLLEILHSMNQAAITLFIQEKDITVVLMSSKGIFAEQMTVSDQTISQLSEYSHNLQELEPNPLMFDISTKLTVNADSIIPEKLISKAINYDSLIIIPHGQLHLLPWAGLMYKGKRLFEYTKVGVLPNLSCLISLSENPLKNPKIALFGPPDYTGMKDLSPLNFSVREIDEISKIYNQHGGIINNVLSSTEANEKNFWKLLRESERKVGILHISCHGGMETNEPMNSGLYTSNGKLDAAEIARSSMPFSEVILSACSSGWRPTKVADVELVADDILGLPGAFLEAGTQSVLVSIPKASDQVTAEFMIEYHKHRAEGEPPLQAYNTTQINLLSANKYKPAFWIGFTLYGCR